MKRVSKSMVRERGPASKQVGRCVVWDCRDLDRWTDNLGDAKSLSRPLEEADRERKSRKVADRIR